MMKNRDGLTDEEFEEATILAKALIRREGVTEFYSDCLSFAQNRLLSRRQLDRLRYVVRRGREERPVAQKMFPRVGKSKRQITLAKHA